jgi:hypothetical protein
MQDQKKLPLLSAELAYVSVGGVRINCYRVEGMEGYYHSVNQLAAALSVHRMFASRTKVWKSMSQKTLCCRLQTLGSKTKSMSQISRVTLLSTMFTNEILLEMSQTNATAYAIVGALMERSLTQMADVAFGVHRSDAEYQALTDAAYSLLRDKFRKQYIPKFHDYLVAAWRKLTKVPTGIQSSSHWRANEVYKLKKAIGLDYLTTVDEYTLPDLQRYEQALLDYDCQRRSGLSHRAAYRKLAETVASLQELR